MPPPLAPSPGDRSRLDLYYREGGAWSGEVLDGLRRSRRTAWVCAAAALVAAAGDGAALTALGPVRRPLAYVVRVDRQRDDALGAHALAAGRLQDDPALIEATAAQYVIAREEFDATRLGRDYAFVQRLTAAPLQSEYARSFTAASALSPLHLYAPGAVLRVEVRSVSLVDPRTALVRYDTRRTDLQGAQPEGSQAYVTYGHTRAPMRNLDRYDNPLGFQVTAYRKQPA